MTIFDKQGTKWRLLLLSLIVGLAQGVYLFDQFECFRLASETAIAFENKRGEIARLDEVLTMSARLYAATGERTWRQRYLAHVEPLDRVLGEALALAADERALRAVDQVSHANDRLIALEDSSLGLTADGRLDDALALLTSEDYERQKAVYQNGLTQALQISQGILRTEVERLHGSLLFAIVMVMTSLLALSELWRRLSVQAQKRAAERIERSLEREQRLSSLQRQFVSILSHELRTPLAIIDGRAQRLLRLSNPTEEQIRKSGETIRQAADDLVGLMEGVLNLSRIEEGGIDVDRKDFDLAALIETVVDGHRDVDERRQIDLSFAGLPRTVHGDPRLLTQVVSNLVSNALKYSELSSPVRVEGYAEDAEIVIAVHDRGVGIPKDEIEKIGQRFFRASSSAGVSGTGIGLHFIKHVVDLHGGQLEIESAEGIGSSFFVRLPRRNPERPAAEIAPEALADAALQPALPVH